MHEGLSHVGSRRLLVFLGAEACKAVIAEECMHFAVVDAGDYDVYTEVKFEAVKEKWVVDVSLHDHFLGRGTRNFTEVLEKDDIVTHASLLRLGYEYCILVFCLVLYESRFVLREGERFWHEVELVWIVVISHVHHSL